MPLPINDTIGILADNLRLRQSVLPIPVKSATRWAEGLNLPHGGETVIYTGLLFQLIPFIEELTSVQERLDDSWLSGFTGLGRWMNKFINVSAFMARPTVEVQKSFDQVLINIALLLKQAGLNFGYLYKHELYSGALIYDLGMDETLKAHAQKVYATFKQYGVKKVITVDPHTTNMLRSVYPTVIDSYDLEVKSYLEVLAEKGLLPVDNLTGEVVIHDSCVFARYENVIDQPRELLVKTGLTIKEPEDTGKFTWCCGGPIESLYPKKAFANAQKRAAQLQQAAKKGVTMCPLCYVNLTKAAGNTMNFQDISHYLRLAYVSNKEVK